MLLFFSSISILLLFLARSNNLHELLRVSPTYNCVLACLIALFRRHDCSEIFLSEEVLTCASTCQKVTCSIPELCACDCVYAPRYGRYMFRDSLLQGRTNRIHFADAHFLMIISYLSLSSLLIIHPRSHHARPHTLPFSLNHI